MRKLRSTYNKKQIEYIQINRALMDKYTCIKRQREVGLSFAHIQNNKILFLCLVGKCEYMLIRIKFNQLFSFYSLKNCHISILLYLSYLIWPRKRKNLKCAVAFSNSNS